VDVVGDVDGGFFSLEEELAGAADAEAVVGGSEWRGRF